MSAIDATVDSTTAALQATSLEDAAASASAAEGRRLYIGNLAYSTTETELKDFFKGFTVESVSIPTNPRTGRAVGYAFVDVATKEDAETAISTLSGQEVLERKVSVQVARKPGEAGPNEKIKTKKPRAEKTEKTEGAEAGTEVAAEGVEEEGEKTIGAKRGRGGHRGRGRGRGRGGLKGRGERAEGSAEEGEGQVHVLPLTEATNAAGDEGAAITSGEAKPRFAKKTTRGPPENGVPSNTKVMVANLPYELTEEKLKELFADYEPESAKIALRPIPRFMVKKLQARGEARKGRGFGFVTLSSHEMQQKAVNEMNDKTVDGRIIAVKVAIDNPKLEEEMAAAASGDDQKENGAEESYIA